MIKSHIGVVLMTKEFIRHELWLKLASGKVIGILNSGDTLKTTSKL